jgi:pimeloyl-ACP methyl ester carboxylesterase
MMRTPLQAVPAPFTPLDAGKSLLGVREGSPYLNVDGTSLAWEESGEGVPVICLHAAGHGAADFRLFQEESPAGCRLMLLDWPGHGRSGDDARSFTVERCVSLLAGFMNAQGLRHAVLLGSEFGAAVALAFALRHPLRVRGLILCQPAGLVPAVAPPRSSRLKAALGRRLRPLQGKRTVTPAETQEQRIQVLQAEHALQCNQASLSVLALEDALRSALAQILCPVLVALAAKSRTYPLRPFERFLAPFIGVSPLERPGRPKLAIFSGSRSPLWENPARLALVVSGFAGATLALAAHQHSWTLAAADWPARGLNQWLCTHPGCYAAQALPVDQNPNLPRPGRRTH